MLIAFRMGVNQEVQQWAIAYVSISHCTADGRHSLRFRNHLFVFRLNRGRQIVYHTLTGSSSSDGGSTIIKWHVYGGNINARIYLCALNSHPLNFDSERYASVYHHQWFACTASTSEPSAHQVCISDCPPLCPNSVSMFIFSKLFGFFDEFEYQLRWRQFEKMLTSNCKQREEET